MHCQSCCVVGNKNHKIDSTQCTHTQQSKLFFVSQQLSGQCSVVPQHIKSPKKWEACNRKWKRTPCYCFNHFHSWTRSEWKSQSLLLMCEHVCQTFLAISNARTHFRAPSWVRCGKSSWILVVAKQLYLRINQLCLLFMRRMQYVIIMARYVAIKVVGPR